MARDFIIVVLV